MVTIPDTVQPDRWLTQIFTARPAAEGGAVRRSLADFDRIAGRTRLLAELDRRGFQAVENAGQVIILCNRDLIRRLR